MNKAFVLGAGLGERLRPLTAQRPKPLIPIMDQPLITHAFEALRAVGAREFVVNTHHLPQVYEELFPTHEHAGCPLHFRFEPTRLETGGGLANVRDLLDGPESFMVFNGDVLAQLDLQRLLEVHHAQGNLVTLGLRSAGPALHIGFDAASGRVTDIRNKLGTGNEGTHLFTGIYVVHPRFFDWLTPGKIESVITPFLTAIERGERIGGVLLDEGQWWDLGSRGAYLDVHRALLTQPFIGSGAQVAGSAVLSGGTAIGAGASVGAEAVLEDCVLWPGARVAEGAHLRRCIVRTGVVAAGNATDQDF